MHPALLFLAIQRQRVFKAGTSPNAAQTLTALRLATTWQLVLRQLINRRRKRARRTLNLTPPAWTPVPLETTHHRARPPQTASLDPRLRHPRRGQRRQRPLASPARATVHMTLASYTVPTHLTLRLLIWHLMLRRPGDPPRTRTRSARRTSVLLNASRDRTKRLACEHPIGTAG